MGECSLPRERSEWLETSIYSNRNITEHCAELKDWNEELEKFIYKYNHYRPHNSLENEPYMSDNGILVFQLDDLRAKFAEGF